MYLLIINIIYKIYYDKIKNNINNHSGLCVLDIDTIMSIMHWNIIILIIYENIVFNISEYLNFEFCFSNVMYLQYFCVVYKWKIVECSMHIHKCT